MALKPMFTSIAQRYDLVNRVITWGLDRWWRMLAARECRQRQIILDLACGTGDMTLHLRQIVGPSAHILSLDFSEEMLSFAKFKATQQRSAGSPMHDFILADASRLPLKNSSLDCIVLSFAFRNLTFRNPVATTFLSETTRVLKPSSQLTFIETSQPRNTAIRTAYHLYLQKIVPRIGSFLTGKRGAYAYLGYSASHYPDAETVVKWLKQAGFRRVRYKLLTLGVVGIFSAEK